MKRCFLVVIDSLGVGEAPDAKEYGDEGVNTLGNVAKHIKGVDLPTFDKLGFGKITSVLGLGTEHNATVGRLSEVSIGNDSTTGHWEIAGLVTTQEFQTFPDGFPTELINKIEDEINYKFIGNIHASGTEIIKDLGEQHMETKELILYTSGDSVFQIAAHTDIYNLEELYRICEISRKHCNEYNIGRVIARPFKGPINAFERTYDRKDFGMNPPGETLISYLSKNNIKTYGIGKISDLFGTEFLSSFVHTEGDQNGIDYLLKEVESGNNELTFVNLVDLDMLYGHREDPDGYYKGLQIIDKGISSVIEKLKENDLLILTGDHGTDPTDGKTDHSREYVPFVAYRKNCVAGYIGDVEGFANIASTVSEFFNLENIFPGKSFLNQI
ncbi:phosphopentomutase [Acidimicrobiaceae bacterium]|nr:phosphopentomutase [Acidimicrobiaceae bacterium]